MYIDTNQCSSKVTIILEQNVLELLIFHCTYPLTIRFVLSLSGGASSNGGPQHDVRTHHREADHYLKGVL